MHVKWTIHTHLYCYEFSKNLIPWRESNPGQQFLMLMRCPQCHAATGPDCQSCWINHFPTTKAGIAEVSFREQAWLSAQQMFVNRLLFQSGLPDFSGSKHTKTENYIPNDHKLGQKAVNYTNGHRIFQMVIKYNSIFYPKALQILPKLGFLVWKQTIWQPWLQSEESND
jgi:hypothetical protein